MSKRRTVLKFTDQEDGRGLLSSTPRQTLLHATFPCVTTPCTFWRVKYSTKSWGLAVVIGGQNGQKSHASNVRESDVFTVKTACARSVCVLVLTAAKCYRAVTRWIGARRWRKLVRARTPTALGTGEETHALGGLPASTRSVWKESRELLRLYWFFNLH